MNPQTFYETLWVTLLANSPKDTRNMVRHIVQFDFGDTFWINISGPTEDGYDYASFVNYNPQRTPKEMRNFKWVERTINEVVETLGGNAQYELS